MTLERKAKIIRSALQAHTLSQAQALQQLIAADVGAQYERPIADTWANFGVLSTTGSFDHKIIENVTNMQDALLERYAARRFGDLARVPYNSPHEAAEKLLASLPYESVADQVKVDFYESDPPAKRTKRITAVFRDQGSGIQPRDIAKSIFSAGSTHKSELVWQQGAFGFGARATFTNAHAVVLVTRAAPEFDPEEDRITVAVVLWRQLRKVMSAYYLVTSDWKEGENRSAQPWSAPASAFPDFAPGTHLALVSYGVEGYNRKEGDQRSFDRVLDTRLFRPTTAVRFTNNIITSAHPKNLRGLSRQLQDNPRTDRREGNERLPYRIGGKTYHLPITFFVFMGKPGQIGARRNFVAHDHAVAFTSGGQVHHHWKPEEFRYRTRLNRLHDRLFVVVETDELPIEVRTQLFAATRTGIVPKEDANRLEGLVAGFLDEWDELREINGELIRESLTARANGQPTLDVARQISRALKIRGFTFVSSKNGVPDNPRRKRPKIDLYPDPTSLEGPDHIQARTDRTKSVHYTLNAQDEFMDSGRGRLVVTCDHPDITERDITIGQLRNGRVRVMLAVPDDAHLGTFSLTAVVRNWHRSSGGLGPELSWITKVDVIDDAKEAREKSRENKVKSEGAAGGGQVAVVWESADSREDWDGGVPGCVEEVPACEIAVRSEYRQLKKLGDFPVPTLFLNQDYGPLKRYISGRLRSLASDSSADRARDRYAVGVGVGLVMLHQDCAKRFRTGRPVDQELLVSSQRAVAQAALSVLPEFDRLTMEAGFDF